MIVTCPGCSSKYRVRNEAVPTDGARMRCPKCETLFLAKPPSGPDAQQQLGDEPSSMFVQLNPSTTNTGPHALRNLPVGSPQQPQQPQAVPAPPQFAQQQPQPAFAAPQPAFGAPQPAFGAPQPAFGAPQQGFGAPQQAFGAPQQPSFGTQPQFGAPQPFTPPPAPFAAPQPAFAPAPMQAPSVQAQQAFPGTPTQQAFGAPQPFAPAPSPFGQPQAFAPGPSPFGAPQPLQQPSAGPFGGATQSFTPQASSSPAPFAPPQATPSSFGQPQPPQTQSFTQQPAPAQPQSGPITALFQAFDPGALPAEAQRPAPTPSSTSASGQADASGLSLDDSPKVKLAGNASSFSSSSSDRPLTRPSAQVPASLRKPSFAPSSSFSAGPGMGAVVASWALLVLAVVVAAGGTTFALWTTETANLDPTLMPVFEHTFGRTPPKSTVKRPEELDELRAQATQAMSAGDLPRAVVLWRRVKARAPEDPRAAPLIAKCLSDLGDLQGAT